ncbi:cellulase family glycosylhydrolase [Metabacillus litoralis]|uniref:cellulase family glycosylhydrolase n=1 Tax=Metabacillus litoralis TaxID=152268 RepID=UPI001CFE084E|nr:cellulase family glycosylhydrolase [Metabacillus litoralis]
MRYLKLLLPVLLLIGLTIPTIGFAEEAENVITSTETPTYDIVQYANDMQPGWNLGNTFDGFDTNKVVLDETAWGNPEVTKELITKIKNQGFNSIRIPITFDTRLGDAPDYTINPEFLSRVDKVVNLSLEADLKVMINIHHDSWSWVANGMPSDHETTLLKFNSIWMQLSTHFKDYPSNLMFESLNEPQFWGDGGDVQGQQFLNELNDSFYEIVRNSGGTNETRALVIPSYYTNFENQVHVDNLYNWIIEKEDPYIISTVHYYGYWPFSVNIAGTSTFDEQTINHINENFNRIYDKFTSNGIPVVVGEFGLLGFDQNTGTIQQGEKLKFFEYMISYAEQKGIIHMLWDNGQHFNRSTLEWNDPQLYDMMKASWEGRSSTADTDFIFMKQGQEITDVTRTFNLNGNQFVSLKNGDRTLVAGEDYVLEGDKLTLKASLLSQFSSDKLGETSVLTTTFNEGANWYFTIYNHDTPIVSDSSGAISDFSIPMQFNGNSLKTMEAIYVDDKSVAGPQNWTSYKEFGYAFAPSYEDNAITFPFGKDRFFKEIEENRSVQLTFHFWSGEKVEYIIKKDGDTVVGTTVNPPGEDDNSDTPDDGDNTNEPGNDDNNDSPDDGDTNDPGDDDNNGSPGDDNSQTPVDKNTGTSGENGSNDHSNQGNTNENTNGGESKGNVLPNTATTDYHSLILGFVFLISGSIFAFFSRKKSSLYN